MNVYKNINKFFCIHKWIVVLNTGLTIYEKCDKCQSKKISQKDGNYYQPINFKFLGEQKMEINIEDYL